MTVQDAREFAGINIVIRVLPGVTLRSKYEGRDAMTAKVISLCDYQRNRDAEKRSKNARGLGFPNDFNPFEGLSDQFEDFGFNGLFRFDEPIQGIKILTPNDEEE